MSPETKEVKGLKQQISASTVTAILD